ncbi:class II D-tagatose-bisphosphate aldolase non-catalytic subunit, partial [Salmonella enterica subsp. enterica serovar Infantis]
YDHTHIIQNQPHESNALSASIKETPIDYEAHSTEYQTRKAYTALERHQNTIINVRTPRTFALPESIISQAQKDKELKTP